MPKGNKGVPKPCTPRNLERMWYIYKAVSLSPGLQPVEIAEKVGLTKKTVLNNLVSMDRGGFFLGEDENNCLYPFRVVEPKAAMQLQRQIWT